MGLKTGDDNDAGGVGKTLPRGGRDGGGVVADGGRQRRATALTPKALWKRLKTFHLIPGDPFLTIWGYFMVLVGVANGISIPFMIAFRYLYLGSFVCQYILDALYVIDMFLKLHTSYLDRGFFVVFPKEMALHYIKSYEFSFDVVANIPYDLVALAWARQPNAAYFLSVTRLPKLMRTFKLVWWFHKEEKRLSAQAVFQMYKFAIYITLITHWCTCIWYAMACPDACLAASWVGQQDQLGNTDRLSMYDYSLYWVVMSMTTTGYGDVHATNDVERVWSIVCMIVGVFLYGYVSGTIASSLSNLDSRRVGYRQKLDAIKHYMTDQDMDKAMQRRVTDWYEYTWERNQGIDVINVFNDLPSTFRAEVAMSLNEDILDKVTIFDKTSFGFRRMLSLAMRINFFTSDTYIVHNGEMSKEMFFVVQGRVDIMNEDESKALSSMVEGSYFGEFMLVLDQLCDASAIAMCNCDIYVLTKEDYQAACDSYPADAALVQAATREALKKHTEKRVRGKRGKGKGGKADQDHDHDHEDDLMGSGYHIDPHAPRSNPASLGRMPLAQGVDDVPHSYGYFIMDAADQKRIEEIKLHKEHKSRTTMLSRISLANSVSSRPIDPIGQPTPRRKSQGEVNADRSNNVSDVLASRISSTNSVLTSRSPSLNLVQKTQAMSPPGTRPTVPTVVPAIVSADDMDPLNQHMSLQSLRGTRSPERTAGSSSPPLNGGLQASVDGLAPLPTPVGAGRASSQPALSVTREEEEDSNDKAVEKRDVEEA
ncbi:hypothetical protein RI367_001495 [Sorochytrium milnesiophthora]